MSNIKTMLIGSFKTFEEADLCCVDVFDKVRATVAIDVVEKNGHYQIQLCGTKDHLLEAISNLIDANIPALAI